MATAIAVKNTFLQVEGGAPPAQPRRGRAPRPRGETFDVSELATCRPHAEIKISIGEQHLENRPEADEEEEAFAEGVNTTIMLRNIPNKYTQKMLLDVIEADFQGLFDFFYLPIDFKNKCNVGYAFINFIEPYYCELFWKKFSGRKLTGFKSKKVCDVSWGRVQGLKNNLEHYRNSSIMSLTCQEYKPLLFRKGQPIPFPPPKSAAESLANSPETTASTSPSPDVAAREESPATLS